MRLRRSCTLFLEHSAECICPFRLELTHHSGWRHVKLHPDVHKSCSKSTEVCWVLWVALTYNCIIYIIYLFQTSDNLLQCKWIPMDYFWTWKNNSTNLCVAHAVSTSLPEFPSAYRILVWGVWLCCQGFAAVNLVMRCNVRDVQEIILLWKARSYTWGASSMEFNAKMPMKSCKWGI